jgi:transposase-like protein
MKNSRKNHTPTEKVAILRKHLLEKVPVSDACEQAGLNPTLFYRWLKIFFENGEAAFEKTAPRKQKAAEAEKIVALEAKLRRKDEVLSELMEEHVALKKELGGL